MCGWFYFGTWRSHSQLPFTTWAAITRTCVKSFCDKHPQGMWRHCQVGRQDLKFDSACPWCSFCILHIPWCTALSAELRVCSLLTLAARSDVGKADFKVAPRVRSESRRRCGLKWWHHNVGTLCPAVFILPWHSVQYKDFGWKCHGIGKWMIKVPRELAGEGWVKVRSEEGGEMGLKKGEKKERERI